jgi:hypothetical protein
MLQSVVIYRVTDVSQVLTASIIRAVNFYETTRHNIPEDIFMLAAVRTWHFTYRRVLYLRYGAPVYSLANLNLVTYSYV